MKTSDIRISKDATNAEIASWARKQMARLGRPAPDFANDDWRYGTNHIADGEFVEFGGGTMIARLDGDTASDDTYNGLGYPSTCGANPCVSHAVSGKLECGGVTRAILCCK